MSPVPPGEMTASIRRTTASQPNPAMVARVAYGDAASDGLLIPRVAQVEEWASVAGASAPMKANCTRR